MMGSEDEHLFSQKRSPSYTSQANELSGYQSMRTQRLRIYLQRVSYGQSTNTVSNAENV